VPNGQAFGSVLRQWSDLEYLSVQAVSKYLVPGDPAIRAFWKKVLKTGLPQGLKSIVVSGEPPFRLLEAICELRLESIHFRTYEWGAFGPVAKSLPDTLRHLRLTEFTPDSFRPNLPGGFWSNIVSLCSLDIDAGNTTNIDLVALGDFARRNRDLENLSHSLWVGDNGADDYAALGPGLLGPRLKHLSFSFLGAGALPHLLSSQRNPNLGVLQSIEVLFSKIPSRPDLAALAAIPNLTELAIRGANTGMLPVTVFNALVVAVQPPQACRSPSRCASGLEKARGGDFWGDGASLRRTLATFGRSRLGRRRIGNSRPNKDRMKATPMGQARLLAMAGIRSRPC
jgi:hypothetical protein